MLSTLINNSTTDKNTLHSYLDTYELLLSNKRESAKNVLEIGINTGGSIKLWRDYFNTATIYGVDVGPLHVITEKSIINNPTVKLFTSVDGYSDSFFRSEILNKVVFDTVIDDGPHTLQSMKRCISLYTQVLADDGVLIIEDVQSFDWIAELKNVVPEDLKKYIQVFDLRKNKGRYDDIMFVINRQLNVA
jgi:hypothetical protein